MIEEAMSEGLADKYKELFHYTTAVGLEGIIRSQTLRATHYRFVNDSAEFTTFFNGRLSELIREAADAYMLQFQNLGQHIELAQIEATVRIAQEELFNAYITASKALYEPYLLSFCGVSADKSFATENGLLSQWRGYGQDGGYAIVFDTKLLEERFRRECEKYHYLFNQFAPVDYYDPSAQFIPTNPDRDKHEAALRRGIANFFTKEEKQPPEVFNSLLAMSCSQKHIGFHEESEVRVVAVPFGKQFEGALIEGNGKRFVDYEFNIRKGVLVPYITLYRSDGELASEKLPIRKIIVGPHPDRLLRMLSVERLLLKYGIDAKVTASDIPYTGM